MRDMRTALQLIFPEDPAHLNQVSAQNKLVTITGAPHHCHRAPGGAIGQVQNPTKPKAIGIDNRATLNFHHPVPWFYTATSLDAHLHDLT